MPVMRTRDLETGEDVTIRLSRRNCQSIGTGCSSFIEERLHAMWQRSVISRMRR